MKKYFSQFELNTAISKAIMKGNVNSYRQYLQTAYVKQITQLVDEKSIANDVTKAITRFELKKIGEKMNTVAFTNGETKSYRSNLVLLSKRRWLLINSSHGNITISCSARGSLL